VGRGVLDTRREGRGNAAWSDPGLLHHGIALPYLATGVAQSAGDMERVPLSTEIQVQPLKGDQVFRFRFPEMVVGPRLVLEMVV
jgi:hypothetical protein